MLFCALHTLVCATPSLHTHPLHTHTLHTNSLEPKGNPLANQATVGSFRITAMSPTLVRVEPEGPKGFEDRTTFTVVDRESFAGIPISIKNKTDTVATLSTQYYDVILDTSSQPPAPLPTCSSELQDKTDVSFAVRSSMYPSGVKVKTSAECCNACEKDGSCAAFVFDPHGEFQGTNCWPLSSFSQTVSSSNRQFGCAKAGCGITRAPKFTITAPNKPNQVLYDSFADSKAAGQSGRKLNLLHWPSPLKQSAYGLMDYPRFFVPPWGTAPIPKDAKVDPELAHTNGYDFENNMAGDMYVFLLGENIDSWNHARSEFVKLAGPCPQIPDYAFGTWFTWWHSYTEAEAHADVERWSADELPLSVWALDMNWRNTSNNQDRFYNHPAVPNLFSNFTNWFEYLRDKKLRTYFNDHPFPVAGRNAGGLQTSSEEVSFRWTGLSEWMERGLTFWWFDHNWKFSIPPPFVNISHTSGVWDGLDNAAWGSHVYYNAVDQFDKNVRAPAGDNFFGRPMTLTKFGLPDARPNMNPIRYAESPAHHRFPVWWTGDGVNLQASVETMVHSGVHGFKPYVHSDCGGDYRSRTGGDLLRWTAHCAFGTIHRFHGSDHRPWGYDTHTENIIRNYLNMRYKLMPIFISAGKVAEQTAFPLVARCDLFWPSYNESASADQYIHLNDTLVAPIFTSLKNETSRQVWIPPGQWQDAWTGSVLTGPKTITVVQPYERQPMWHRHGGMVIMTDTPSLRVEDADWSSLTLDIFPMVQDATTTYRRVFERESSQHAGSSTELLLHIEPTDEGRTIVTLKIGQSHVGRAWVLRLHLLPDYHVISATNNFALDVQHILPRLDDTHLPFGGAGTPPARKAGLVGEIQLVKATHAQEVTIQIGPK